MEGFVVDHGKQFLESPQGAFLGFFRRIVRVDGLHRMGHLVFVFLEQPVQPLLFVHGESLHQVLVVFRIQDVIRIGQKLGLPVGQGNAPVVHPDAFSGEQFIGLVQQLADGQPFVHRREFPVRLVPFQDDFGLVAFVGPFGQFDFIIPGQKRHPADFLQIHADRVIHNDPFRNGQVGQFRFVHFQFVFIDGFRFLIFGSVIHHFNVLFSQFGIDGIHLIYRDGVFVLQPVLDFLVGENAVILFGQRFEFRQVFRRGFGFVFLACLASGFRS